MASNESPKDKIYPFRDPGGKQTDYHLKAITRVAIARGLVPDFEFPVELDEAMQDHIRETWPPRSPNDYLGREHIRYIGEKLGLDVRAIGRLTNAVMHPLRAKNSSIVIPPSKLGLAVASRKEVDMPTPGFRIAETSLTRAQRLHQEDPEGNKISPTQCVIQIAGLLKVAASPDLMSFIDGLNTEPPQRDFAAIAYKLGQLVNPQV